MKGPVNTPGYVLPKATEDTLGGVKVGENLDVEDGKLSVKTDGVWATIKAKADALYSLVTHRHDNATKTADGFMSATDKATLDAVAPTYIKGLSVNGQTVTYTKGDGSTGTIKTQDSQYSVFTGASDSAAGTKGLVPTPAKGQGSYYLTGASAWKEFPTTIDNATHWNGYTMRLDHNTSDTWIPVFSDGNVDYITKEELLQTASGVTATSGSNYVRYSDGTQICWGSVNCEGKNAWFGFPQAFANTSYFVSVQRNYSIKNANTLDAITSKSTTGANLYITNTSLYERWFMWIAIGRWK